MTARTLRSGLGFFKPVAAKVTGVSDRTAHNRSTMEQTLANLAAAAESTD